MQLLELEAEVKQLRQSLDELRERFDSQQGLAGPELALNELQAIVEITKRLYPGPVSIEIESDPEWPAEKYLVFGVRAQGDVASIVDRRCQWLDEIRRVAPGCRNARLAIDPRP